MYCSRMVETIIKTGNGFDVACPLAPDKRRCRYSGFVGDGVVESLPVAAGELVNSPDGELVTPP